jgi:endo-1,4-beta-D-glucanase Y
LGTPTPASGGANFPFPQRRFSASCLYPVVCNDADVRVGWENYKRMFVVDGGDGTLRVQRPLNDNDTVSEGIAYGMLFAVFLNDKDTFDKLWKYAGKHLDDNGLMHWQILSNGERVGHNSATDSDEDMGFALVMAEKQWGGYASTAKDFLGKVAQFDFHMDGTIRGGDAYDPVNPSYLAPAFYRTFAAFTGDERWTKILDKSYEILNGAAHATTGLVPDWSSGRDGPNYTYDAARTPYRIALDACWNGEPRAKAYAEKVGAFFAGITVANIRDGFALDGMIIDVHQNSTFIGPAGTAGMVGNQTQLVEDTYAFVAKDLNEGIESYYNMSWALFTAMMMTGNFSDLTK